MNFSSRRRSYDSRSRSKKRPVRFIVSLLIIFVLIAGFVLLGRKKANAPQVSQDSADTNEVAVPTKATGKYMFSGTIVLARAVENDAKTASGYDYSLPFSKMNTFNPKQYDAWLADWECPTSDKITIPYAQQIANLQFNCRPEWLPEVNKYFSAMNLANNHSGDLGQETFLATQQHLIDSGLQVVGNYDPTVTEDICEIMSLPVHLKMPDGSSEKAKLPIAHCAWHYFTSDPSPGEIETMERYAKIMPVFGLMHVGVEYVATAGANQAEVAKKIIDSGAEFVIGNSPHWVQNTEVYKGKPIFYSTGNFIFDQLESETNRGLSIAVSMSADYDDNLAKWLSLGKSCETWRDNCLEQAEQMGLSKIKVDLKYEPVANTSGAHDITELASPSIQKAVEQRMNWSQTKMQLGQ